MMVFKLTWRNWLWFMYAAFHKALYRNPSRDTDELDVVLLQIDQGICVPKIIKIQFGLINYGKNKMVQFFWLTVYMKFNLSCALVISMSMSTNNNKGYYVKKQLHNSRTIIRRMIVTTVQWWCCRRKWWFQYKVSHNCQRDCSQWWLKLKNSVSIFWLGG